MKNTAIILALAVLGGCSTIVSDEVAGDSSDQARADSPEVWVTIGSDAVDVVIDAIYQGELLGEVETYDSTDDATVIKITEAQIPALTRIMHDHLHRCGGYVVHDSFKQAMNALDNSLAKVAMQKAFVAYTIDNSTVVNAMIADMQEPQISGTISTLSSYINRYYTTQSGVDSAVWIRDKWLSLATGRSDVTVELYSHSGYGQPSVIMTIQGDVYPNEVVVMGAHLDSTAGYGTGSSTSAPGADDDASGIATLTEVARVALSSGYAPERTIKFMGYAAEEVGLRGSGDIADDFASQGINVVGVLQLDMTNYNGSAQDIVLVDDNTNAAQNTFIGNLIDTYLPSLSWTYTSCGYGCSDHASWTSAGYPASLPFESLFNDYNPYIHTASDTLNNSGGNAVHALKFAKLASAYMAEMAKGALDGTPGGGDPPPPPPTPTTETFSDSVSQGQNINYGPFSVEPGTNFTAEISGTGDADLYVKFGSAPTTSSYDCRPYKNGSAETCSLIVPAGETAAYVMVRGYTSATYTLDVTYVPGSGGPPPPPPPTPTTETFSDSVAQGQNINYGPFSVASGTNFTAEITGSGDADLYVKFGSAPTTSSYDCRPYKNGSNETCSLNVPAGQSQAYVMVRGYTSATYDLTVTYTSP